MPESHTRLIAEKEIPVFFGHFPFPEWRKKRNDKLLLMCLNRDEKKQPLRSPRFCKMIFDSIGCSIIARALTTFVLRSMT